MKITDEMLYRHVPEARDVWLASLPDDSEIPEHQFSEEFNREMERLVSLSQKQKKSKKKFQRIAAMFAAVLIGASSFVTINSAARIAFVGWIKELTSDYLVYRFEEDPVSDTKPMLYCPTWIPDGYEQFHFKNSNGSVALLYKNDSGEMIKLRYIYNPDKTDWFISTENTTKQSTTVNGNKVQERSSIE